MSQAKAFRAEARFVKETGQRVQSVGIQCRKCETEEWHPAPHAGWGRRIFKKKGWAVGNSMNSHTCPTCLAKRRAGRPELATDIEIVAPPVAYVEPPPAPEPVNTIMAEVLAPVAEKMEQDAKTYPTLDAAAAAARFVLVRLDVKTPQRGKNYRVEGPNESGRYNYVLLSTASFEPPPNWKPRGKSRSADLKKPSRLRGDAKLPGQIVRGTAANVRKSAVAYLTASGVFNPQEGVHYRIVGTSTDPLRPRLRNTMTYQVLSTNKSTEKPMDDLHPFRTESGARYAARMEVSRRNPLATPQRDHDYFISEKDGWFGYSLSPPSEAPATQPDEPYEAEVVVTRKDDGVQLPPPLVKVRRPRKLDGRVKPPGYTYTEVNKARFGAIRWLQAMGVADPLEGIHYRLVRGAKHGNYYYGHYELIDQAQAAQAAAAQFTADIQAIAATVAQEPPMSDASTQAVRDAEPAYGMTSEGFPPPPEGARTPTRDQNKRIRDMLDTVYDEPNGRYKGVNSDAKVAADMKLPRKWIADVREGFFGPEGNEAAEIEKRRMLEKLSLAQAKIEAALETVNKVVELAADLERQRADIRALVEAAK